VLAQTDGSAVAAGLLVFVLFMILCGFIGRAVGLNKGFAGLGFVLGLLLGPIGILIVAVMPRTPEAEALHEHERAMESWMR
jgi:hypothetical protein